MREGYSRFYADPALQALFARELNALESILSGVYGNSGLFIQAHSSIASVLPAHLLRHVVELVPSGRNILSGAVRAEPTALPFGNDSFRLVVVQHGSELVDDADAFAGELSRVLAPEGIALVLGFNPYGSWRPWLSWQAARGARLRLRSSHEWQHVFARQHIETLQIRYPGLILPNDPSAPVGRYARWITKTFARFGSSWLLLARKRRSTLTPLRLRSAPREMALNPRLAPGAHRACA
ncbi:MAG: methyltransferase domain-containing protein [Rudaea sp.]